MATRETGDLARCPLRAGAYRIAAATALLAALAACRAPSPRMTAPAPAPPAAAHKPADVSYDWHGLLIAPFGSVLKDIPVALHEVLLFRDAEPGSASAAEADTVGAECYAADAPAPPFLGRAPDEHVLCFKQGRLFRIQASVRIAAAEAAEIFAAACADWLKNAAPPATGLGTPGAGTPHAETQSAGACEGRNGDTRFRGRLEEEPDRADKDRTETVLSITLDGAPAP
jgi:hypothetical protein